MKKVAFKEEVLDNLIRLKKSKDYTEWITQDHYKTYLIYHNLLLNYKN